MGRSLPGRLILIGIGLLLCGLGLLLNDTAVAHAETTAEAAQAPERVAVVAQAPVVGAPDAQRQDTPEYVGAEECSSCHRGLSRPHGASQHALALQDTGRNKEPILADFEQAGDLLTLQFPGEDAPRAVTLDDIEYVVGVGRYAQNYLVRIARNDYAVLPATWNTVANAWQPLALAENWPDVAYDWEDNCAYCHTTGLDIESNRWVDDGVQCESCHGPASAHIEAARDAGRNPSEEELVAVRGSIMLTPDSQVCGQCHSQGTDNATGRPYPTTYLPGGDLAAGFTLVPTDDPVHWWPTGHARDKYMQYNEWLVTTHASSLESIKGTEGANERCLTCHSADSGFIARLTAAVEAGERNAPAPDPLTIDSAQFGVACVACHNPHAIPSDAAAPADGDADATADATAEATAEATSEASSAAAAAAAAQAQAAPSVSSDNLRAERYELCTSCHRLSDDSPGIHFAVKEMYEGATIVDVVQGIPSPHKTVENGPDCVACHMANTPIDAYGGLTEGSHTMKPADPALVNPDGTGPQDSCTNCHTDLSPEAMRTFIEGSQEDTQRRLTAAEKALSEDSPTWVRTVLDFVIGDGSLGIHNHRYTAALLDAVEIELGITTAQLPAMPSNRIIQDPATCAECHQDQHRQWLTSPHALASQNMMFREEYARLRQPTFCMGCHGSGFSEDTGAFLFEGVVCSNCHFTENNIEHPPAPMVIASDSQSCGTCHNGAHAPSYDEWLGSGHAAASIDCVDCHTPHNNGLRQGSVNATCGNCHVEATLDPVHMGEDLDCKSCHMRRETDASGIHVIATGHDMSIDPSTCAECHGNVHVLSAVRAGVIEGTEEAPGVATSVHSGAGSEAVTPAATTEDERAVEAQQNVTLGIIGGALGTLVLVAIGALILRRLRA